MGSFSLINLSGHFDLQTENHGRDQVYVQLRIWGMREIRERERREGFCEYCKLDSGSHKLVKEHMKN